MSFFLFIWREKIIKAGVALEKSLRKTSKVNTKKYPKWRMLPEEKIPQYLVAVGLYIQIGLDFKH